MKIDIRRNSAIHSNSIESIENDIFFIGLKLRARMIQFYKLQLLRLQIYNERRVLGKLTDRELEDIGINRQDASLESRRGLRDLPRGRI